MTACCLQFLDISPTLSELAFFVCAALLFDSLAYLFGGYHTDYINQKQQIQ
jgi:hypothetical protein